MHDPFPTSPFGEVLGMVVETAGDGRATISVQVADKLHNSADMLHGGALSAIADGTAGTAISTALAEGEFPVTTDSNISYFKPVRSGKLTCRAEVINRGRNLARVETSIFIEDTLVAKASATFMIVARDLRGQPQGPTLDE